MERQNDESNGILDYEIFQSSIQRDFITLDEHLVSAAVNLTHTFNREGSIAPELKAGLYGEYKTRDYDTRLFKYKWNTTANLPDGFAALPTEEIMVPGNMGTDKIHVQDESLNGDNYSAHNRLLAAYLAINLPLGKLNLYTGARLEQVYTSVTSYPSEVDLRTKERTYSYTNLLGDKQTKAALIIEPGGKIHATGTAQKPIVFTSEQPAGSRRPGDWGGLIICGKARNNKGTMQIEGGPRTKHGGNDDADNSGEIQYVRVEFAGYPFQTDQEINGITFGSVGSGTKIDHLQVSYSNDDSFEWFGGTVSCKYLVAYHGWDDDFDTDNGFSGKMQFLLGVRHPQIADQSLSNGFESDNNADGSTEEPYTTAQFCNVTLVGPIGQHADFFNKAGITGSDVYISGGSLFPNNGSRTGQYQAGVQIRRNSRITLQNAAILGYPVGAIIENDKGSSTQAAATTNGNTIQNVLFGGYDVTATAYDHTSTARCILGCDKNKSWKDHLCTDGSQESSTETSFSHDYVLESSRHNSVYTAIADLKMVDPVSITSTYAINPHQNYAPQSGSPLLNSAFTVPAGFDAAGNGYAGAFSGDGDNWMESWTEFDPQNKIY